MKSSLGDSKDGGKHCMLQERHASQYKESMTVDYYRNVKFIIV